MEYIESGATKKIRLQGVDSAVTPSLIDLKLPAGNLYYRIRAFVYTTPLKPKQGARALFWLSPSDIG